MSLTPVQRALYDEAVAGLRREAGGPAGVPSVVLMLITLRNAGVRAVSVPVAIITQSLSCNTAQQRLEYRFSYLGFKGPEKPVICRA